MVSIRSKVKVGADELADSGFECLTGKNIGVIINHSACLSSGEHLADVLHDIRKFKISAFFGPEHGLRGDSPDGIQVSHEVDPKTKIKIYSLYGKTNKPTAEMLEGIDTLIYDIQDIGARFYTYISTLFLTMEAAAERGIEFIILDRPNPITGLKIEGPILDINFKSFVGLLPLPIVHGMTVGELAYLVNSEGWLANGLKANLKVIKMKGWDRSCWYDETGLQWIKPSPNMTTIDTAVVYPGTCLFEGTNLSEGRGTDNPFKVIGAPFIDSFNLSGKMNSLSLPGIKFEPIDFVPAPLSNISHAPKFVSEKCSGVFLDVFDRNVFEPVKTAIFLLCVIKELFPDRFQWRPVSKSTGHNYFDLLVGTDSIRSMIDSGENPETIMGLYNFRLEKFLDMRKKYLLY